MKDINAKFAKVKVKGLVDLYKVLHKTEYKKFLKIMVEKRNNIKDEGKVKSKTIKRAVLEYPETLADMLENGLTREDYQWFRTMEGAKYLSKIAPEFLLVTKI